jgi:hypothetical protein
MTKVIGCEPLAMLPGSAATLSVRVLHAGCRHGGGVVALKADAGQAGDADAEASILLAGIGQMHLKGVLDGTIDAGRADLDADATVDAGAEAVGARVGRLLRPAAARFAALGIVGDDRPG